MPALSRSLPFNIKKVYGDDPVRSESFRLDNESRAEPGARLARVRLLTDFIFVKQGQLVFPFFKDCTKDFWKNVEVYGFVMAPTGTGKWLAWSLLWHLDWHGKHMELFRISGIHGMSKEADVNFRNGNQVTLWINTSQGNAYALMEPEEQIAAHWAEVRESWGAAGSDKLPVPLCEPVSTTLTRPEWWHKNGRTYETPAWEQLVEKQTKHLKNMHGKWDEVIEGGRTSPLKPQERSRTGEGKSHSSTNRKRGSEPLTGTNTLGRSSKSGPVYKDSVQPKVKRLKSMVPSTKSANNHSSALPGRGPAGEGTPFSSEVEASRLSDDDTHESPPPALKREHMMTAQELAGEPALTSEVLFPETPAENERPQRRPEPSYSILPRAQKFDSLWPQSSSVESTAFSLVGDRLGPLFQSPAVSQGSLLGLNGGELLQLTPGDNLKDMKGGSKRTRALLTTGAATPEDVVSSNIPDVAHIKYHEVADPRSALSGVPNSGSEVAKAVTSSNVTPAHPASSTGLATASLGPAVQGLLSLRGPALGAGTSVPQLIDSEMAHTTPPLHGTTKGATFLLHDHRSHRHAD